MENINQTMKENEGLVWLVINQHFKGGNIPKNYALEKEDIFQIGCIGLFKAIMDHDENISQFSTYAYEKIKGEIFRHIRDNSSSFKVSRYYKAKFKQVKEEDYELSAEEIATKYNETVGFGKFVKWYRSFNLESINKAINDEEDTTLEVMLEDHTCNIEEQIIKQEELEYRLSILKQKERQVLEYRLKGLNQSRVAEILGISQMHVSRLERRSIKKINEHFNNIEVA